MGEDVDQLEAPLYWRFLLLHHNFSLILCVQCLSSYFLPDSPLHWAVAGEHLHIANLLVSIILGLKLSICPVHNIEYVNFSSLRQQMLNSTRWLSELDGAQVSRGASLDLGDKEGNTALALAKRFPALPNHQTDDDPGRREASLLSC